MHIYGLHDSRRVFATMAPILKGMVAYVILTLVINLFFTYTAEGGDAKNALAAHMAIITVLNFVMQTFFMGRIIEIIFGLSPLPAGDLLRRHLPKFIGTTALIAILAVPIFSMVSSLLFKGDPTATFITINTALKLITIYIFPLVFITGQIRYAIKTGVKCLLGNIKDSLFLMALSIFAFLFEGYALPALIPSLGDNPGFVAMATACNIFFSLYIFAAAAWIMQEKLYGSGGSVH